MAQQLGPGLVTGAADDDPSGIATYSQAGAQFGYGLLWTLVLTYPLMTAIQLVSAHIGRVTGAGLAKNMGEVLPKSAVFILVVLLFVANTINIGADVAAMGAAAKLVLGGSQHLYTLGFAGVSLLLQLFMHYHRYARFLKWLTLSLFAYVAVVLVEQLNWLEVLYGLAVPDFTWSKDSITAIVAIFGTTISPYLFFWQSAQEVEEIELSKDAKPLKDETPARASRELSRMKLDTYVGMAFSNLIAIAIVVSAAATLHATGKPIETAADAAMALEPVAGKFAFLLFALGIIGTGMLAIPVLAGSAAYAIGESRGWKTGLEHMPWEATGFYSVIGAAIALGLTIQLSSLDPIKALYWSAVVNGIVAVPMMIVMMIVVSHRKQMGNFTASPGLKFFGWSATAVMAAAAIAMFATLS